VIIYLLLPRLFFKNLWLLTASLWFYFWGEFEYIGVLFLSIFINYIGGFLIEFGKNRKLFLYVTVAINLFILFYYKYLGFVICSIFSSENSITDNWQDIHLPLGISFFTFQGISYLVDLYRKEAGIEKNIFNLALYISMFPQLIAGPIVRYSTIATSLKSRVHSKEKFIHGISLFVIGLGFKVLLANNFALVADTIFDLSQFELSTSLAWLGLLSYTLQIYFDFNGYSVMAIGLGSIFGFKFPLNFNYPYISQSITEFWRRWHITLSTWFKDYLYIPLGGNRKGAFRTYLNLIVVFFLCGIWHGASWIFIFWGLYQGVFLILERLWLKDKLNAAYPFIRHIYTLFVILTGWLLFRSNDMSQFSSYFKTLFGFNASSSIDLLFSEFLTLKLIVLFLFALVLSTPITYKLFIKSDSEMKTLSSLTPNQYQLIVPLLWYILLMIILLLSVSSICNQTYNPFIYFRF